MQDGTQVAANPSRLRRVSGLKLLLVYYEPASSGQTTHVLSLARGLDLRRYELVVVLPQTLAHAIAEFQRMGARVVPLPLRRIAWSPATVAELARLIREWRPDAVHVHSQEAGLVARPVARLSGARSILYTPQTIDIRRSRWQVFYQYLERALGGITDTIVSVNEADRQRLVRWGIPSAKVVTIPNGIVLADFAGTVDASQLRRSLGLDPARPLVLQVGRLSAQKDPLAFVEGAALIAEDRPDVQFALAGDGPLEDRVAARIRELRLERCVSLLGWHERASELMAASNVVT
jgi:glycosyltransferase involved in cell wall biosynthesis